MVDAMLSLSRLTPLRNRPEWLLRCLRIYSRRRTRRVRSRYVSSPLAPIYFPVLACRFPAVPPLSQRLIRINVRLFSNAHIPSYSRCREGTCLARDGRSGRHRSSSSLRVHCGHFPSSVFRRCLIVLSECYQLGSVLRRRKRLDF